MPAERPVHGNPLPRGSSGGHDQDGNDPYVIVVGGGEVSIRAQTLDNRLRAYDDARLHGRYGTDPFRSRGAQNDPEIGFGSEERSVRGLRVP